MFEGIKLPRRLQRHVDNLSATVQVLLSEIVLAVEGFEGPQIRKAETEFRWADIKGKKNASRIQEQLQCFLDGNRIKSDDAAIGVAAAAGRSTGEIADFLGVKQMYAMRRLNKLRKQAESWKPRRHKLRTMLQLCFDFMMDPEEADSETIEVFAEAQRRR